MTQARKRPRLSLDGEWELLVAGSPARRVTVPAPWQTLPALRDYTGTAMYRRRVRIPQEWDGARIRLCFGAVDYRAVVEVNGTRMGEHEGGYLPFDFEIQEVAGPGTEALIEVTVSDDIAPDVPKGKQSWYGPLAGMWQPVWLEAVGDLYIEAIRIDAEPASGRVSVRPSLDGNDRDHHSFRLLVRGPGSEVIAEGTLATVAAPLLWDLDEPNLYTAELSVVRDGAVVDTKVDGFGFRTVEARDGRIWLNGRPILLVGALDQDYYPGTICTPPSQDFVRHQFEMAKQLGLNCLRCHIKAPDPGYLYWADHVGMLIWAELPNWETLTPQAEGRARETLAGIIQRDANHPSIIAWTIVNESWGVNLVGNEAHRAWLRDMVDFVRDADHTRIVVDNSACRPNFHVGGDLNDFHFYTSIPDQRARWDRFLDDWTSDPASTYSPHGDALRRGDEPMVVSEFGNWGLPDPSALREEDGTEPWWFATGSDWAEGVVHPHGVEDRARQWGLDDIFGGISEVFRASQEHQFESIRYEVEQMRLRPEIAGFVVTEFTDVHWECNGLLDLRRGPKAGHAGYRWLFGPDLPIALPERRRCFVGDEISVRLHLAHASNRELAGTLRWRTSDGSGQGAETVTIGGWSASTIGEVIVRTESPGRIRFDMELVDENGDVIGRNATELAVFDRPQVRPPLWSEDPVVAEFLERAEWPLDRARGLRVVTGLGASERATVQLAAAGDGSAGVQAVRRDGSMWEGDWAQGMHWFGPRLRVGTPLLARLDLSCDGIVPEAVLTGPPAETLSGMYVGWIHKAVATSALLSSGAVATTFPILEAEPDDPLAQSLLGNLVQVAAG